MRAVLVLFASKSRNNVPCVGEPLTFIIALLRMKLLFSLYSLTSWNFVFGTPHARWFRATTMVQDFNFHKKRGKVVRASFTKLGTDLEASKDCTEPTQTVEGKEEDLLEEQQALDENGDIVSGMNPTTCNVNHTLSE